MPAIVGAAVPDVGLRIRSLSFKLREHFACRLTRQIDLDARLHRELARLAFAPVGVSGAQDIEIGVDCTTEAEDCGGNEAFQGLLRKWDGSSGASITTS